MPNAAPQPLPEAGAQRTLEAVGCRRSVRQGLLYGYWTYLGLLAGNHKAHDSTPDCAATLPYLV